MKILVLGGTRFVGRAIVADAVERGWEVSAVHRGITGEVPDAVTPINADRTDEAQLKAALGDGTWDLVVDTWARAPRIVQLAASALAGRTGRFGYVSSISVYTDGRPPGGDESWPVVDGDPGADETDYAADKRGGELAVLAADPRALIGRPGMILGPHENIGRLPWWLTRVAQGGKVVAPGRPDLPLQYVDARDLAHWLLDGLASDVSGAADIVTPPGAVTLGAWLDAVVAATGSDAELVWVPEQDLLDAGVQPWTQLPGWIPSLDPSDAGFMSSSTARAQATGLRTRPVEETVRDTWAWLQREPMADFRGHGLPPELEAQVLRDSTRD
jgi:nucleoside-diphosphate-sugar epimerase